jgi:hypothetical protein
VYDVMVGVSIPYVLVILLFVTEISYSVMGWLNVRSGGVQEKGMEHEEGVMVMFPKTGALITPGGPG